FMAFIRHPGVVKAYAMGANKGESFIAMELVDGGKLADKLGKLWPARQAAHFIAALANAVHALHEHGVIHREIDPSPCLLTAGGQPQLAGFRRALWTVSTPDPGLVGNPSYISPEQVVGRGNPGIATDIYALGAVFYELLTVRPPFGEDTARRTLQRVME